MLVKIKEIKNKSGKIEGISKRDGYKIVRHPYHLLKNSLLPIIVSIILLGILDNVTKAINNQEINIKIMIIWLLLLLLTTVYWIKEALEEETERKNYNKRVKKGLYIGFILFVISEAMIFVSLFIALYYNGINSSVEFGKIFPPLGIELYNPLTLPLVNTWLLFSSGAFISLAQIEWTGCIQNKRKVIVYYISGILTGITFVLYQYKEYSTGGFTISDSVYGSTFYMITGFHGFHVILGLIFIGAAFTTLLRKDKSELPLVVKFSSIYYHFVDAIWLIVYFCIYCWTRNI